MGEKIEINECFREALDLVEETDQTVFITGKAGTGKSTLLQLFREQTTKNVVVLAPTGVAALNVKGQTIHSFFVFDPHITKDKIREYRPSKKLLDILENTDVIIIDEVSMVRSDLMDCVDEALRHYLNNCMPFGGIQMVFIGDLYQLPPVVTRDQREMFESLYESPYFFDAKVFEEISLEIIELEKIYRQKDPEFIALLNRIRNSSVHSEDILKLNTRHEPEDFADDSEDEFCITLTTTNAAANEINYKRLQALDEEMQTHYGEIDGEFNEKQLPTALELDFKVGAQIMLLKNDPMGRWVNGSIGKIIRMGWDDTKEQDVMVIELDNGKVVNVSPYTWEIYKYQFDNETGKVEAESIGSFTQYPIRLAWAVTIHKSQGKTFDNVAVDIGRGTFVQGQIYVAISRCTSFEGLRLRRPIYKRHIWIDKNITRFLER